MQTRLIHLAVSWVAISIGIPLLVRARLGVAPFDVLTTGVVKQVGWSFGMAFAVLSCGFYAVGALLGGRLGWASVAGTVLIGRLINTVLPHVGEPDGLLPRVAIWAAGVIIIGVGICFGISSALGPGPSEVFMLGLVRQGMDLTFARWVSDGLPVVVGALLGGSLGVGTLVFAVLMGPMVKRGLGVLGYEPERRTAVGLR